MYFLTFIIICILFISLKTMINHKAVKECIGNFTETAIIDTSGIYSRYGSPEIYGGINYYSNTLGGGGGGNSYANEIGDDNDDGDGEGSGNFTNNNLSICKYKNVKSIQNDFLYLEDVMDNDSLYNCKKNNPHKFSGSTCKYNSNPIDPVSRTIAGTILEYNDDVADPNGNIIKYEDSKLKVPSSYRYNNIYPANPILR